MPGTPGNPAWQGTLRMSDGRTFITDGGLAVDAALARPAALPTRELPAKVLEDYLKASHKNEYGFADLTLAATYRPDVRVAERDCAERDLHQLPTAHRAARITFSDDRRIAADRRRRRR